MPAFRCLAKIGPRLAKSLFHYPWRQVYELFLKHRRKGTVAKLLNAAGYRTRNGKLWRDVHVARTLSDPSAKGVYYFNRFSKHDTKARPTKPESEWGKTDCQPIIPEELWTQVNEITEEQLKSWKKPGPVPVRLLGNIAYCIRGHKMYVRSGTPKYVCRRCHNKISIVDLEGVVYDELKAFFANPEQISRTPQRHKAQIVGEGDSLPDPSA